MSGHRALVLFSLVALAGHGSLACTEHRTDPPSAKSPSPPPTTSYRAYDATRIETIRGTVVRVEQRVATRARGMHVIVRAERGETIDVHLGPAWFVEEQHLALRIGDTVVVTGSPMLVDGTSALIAQKIWTPERELVLRDEAGVPRWSRRGSPPIQPGQDTSALSTTEQQALRNALEDEYRAWATYDQVIRDLGQEPPFIHIREAEIRHIAALRSLFERYGLEIPANTWAGRVPRYKSTREACAAGVESEISNAALYDRLMRSTHRADILAVFGNLQRASQERHLQAFQRCAMRGGRGAGRA